MKLILSLCLSLIFFALAVLHFYWATGGEWAFYKALPTEENGELLFLPRTIDSILVGLALSIFGILYLFQSSFISYEFPSWIMKYAGWIIPIIFLLRAIGEFKYIGFFKSIKNTDFAYLDSIFYSPLCLMIGLIGILLMVAKL